MTSPQDTRPGQSPAGRAALCVAALLLGTLVIRGVVLWAMFGNLRDDPDAYRHIAHNVLAHGVYGRDKGNSEQPVPTAYRPPLYPLLLSKIAVGDAAIPSFNVAVCHVALGIATVGMTLLLGWRLGLGNWTYFAAGLVALDPILLNQSTLVMTETLATFLNVLCLWCLARFHADRVPWNAGLAGGAIGLAILCRPTFLPWLLPVAVVIAWVSPGWPRKVINVAAILMCAAIVVAPWGVRNYRLFGKPILTTTHGGYTVFLGNNPDYYEHIRAGKPASQWDAELLYNELWQNPLPIPKATHESSELIIDSQLYDRARSTVRNDLAIFAYTSAYRVAQLWSPLPNATTERESTPRRFLRYVVSLWYVAVYAFALAALLLRSPKGTPGKYSLAAWLDWPWIYGLLLCLVFTALHSVYWSNLRMRAPLMPLIAVVAAAGAKSLTPKTPRGLPPSVNEMAS